MKRLWLILLTLIVTLATFFGGWELTYPSSNDPKNFRYVFWKAGMWTLNLDMATATMVGSASRDQLVVGKSVSELQGRFGFFLEPSEAPQYLLACYQSSFWKDKKVRFIRNSPWMVVFGGDRAVNLVLIKGC